MQVKVTKDSRNNREWIIIIRCEAFDSRNETSQKDAGP
jgi:hypothetical protein